MAMELSFSLIVYVAALGSESFVSPKSSANFDFFSSVFSILVERFGYFRPHIRNLREKTRPIADRRGLEIEIWGWTSTKQILKKCGEITLGEDRFRHPIVQETNKKNHLFLYYFLYYFLYIKIFGGGMMQHWCLAFYLSGLLFTLYFLLPVPF